MDDPKSLKRGQLPCAVMALIMLLIVAGIATFIQSRREAARERETIATADGMAKVIEAVMSDRTLLVVKSLDGRIDVRSVDHGPIFDTEQNATVPFSVQYSVNLENVGLDKMKYDDKSRLLMVEIPPVAVATNVDETRRVVKNTSGFWVSRRAGQKLSERGSRLASAQAETSARRADRMAEARAAAKEKVEKLIEAPLRAIGRDDVNVAVRFATDGATNDERWDVTPSFKEILARQAEREGGNAP